MCLREAYCSDPSTLPPRARCLGGDVEVCRTLAIKYEFEYVEAAKQFGAASNHASVLLHRAMLTEAARRVS